MSELAQLQAAFQLALLDGDGAVLEALLDGPHQDRATLLAVYRTSHRSRVAEVVAARHPVLRQYLGPTAFAALTDGYVTAHGAGAPLGEVCAALPAHLRETRPFRARPALADLAAIGEAFAQALAVAPAAADAPPTLPATWRQLTLAPARGVSRLALSSNAFAIWTACREGRAPAPETAAAVTLIVWRNGAVAARGLSRREAAAWEAATTTGLAPRGAAAQRAARAWLRRWWHDGLVSRVDIEA